MRFIWASVLLLFSLSLQAENILFYQPLNRDAALNESAWLSILRETEKAGVDTFIVQWTRHGDSDFGGSDSWLVSRLQQAEAMGFKLIVGLYYPADYYLRMADAENIELYWQQWLMESVEQQRLIEETGLSPVGWYIPLELDDSLLADSDSRDAINRQLSIFENRLDMPIHISAFSAGVLTPVRYAEWLVSLPVDQVWWQDGRGTAALPTDIVQAYRKELPCNIGIIAEAFSQTSHGNGPFQAQAALPEMINDCHPQAVFSLRYMSWAAALLSDQAD